MIPKIFQPLLARQWKQLQRFDIAVPAPHYRSMASTSPSPPTQPASADQPVVMEKSRGIGRILLNRPKAMNALNLDMINAMQPKLEAWQADASTKLVLVKGMGGKAFCAGGDIVALTKEKGAPIQYKFFKDEYMLDNLVGSLRIPYVAILNGVVMGGGVGISVHGSHRVCCENTVFAMPETGIGLVPDVGGAFFLPRLEGSLGMFLGLTGHRLKGMDCYHAGIATHAVNSAEIPQLEEEIANNPQDLDAILQKFTDKSNFHQGKGFSLEPHLETINRVFSAATVEEILQLLDAEESEFFAKVAKGLRRCSPSSLKVAHRQLTEGSKLNSLTECLKMEYRLVSRCCENDDFYEGVRALLLDKDNSPKWNPASLEEVTDELVDSYFAALPDDRELNLRS